MGLLNLRNALMAGKRLPYDAEVEFLESTGTQWVDTGLTFDVSSVVDIALGITPTATTGRDDFFYGLENLSSGNIGLELYRADFYFAAGTSEQNLGAATIGARYDFLAHYESGNSWLKTNGTTTATLTNAFTKISSRPMYLFSRYVSPATNTSRAKIYSFKVYKNNVLVRDFVPVRKGTVGYLYDRVSGKLFGNAGTGDFLYGADVVPVEYIESHRTEYIDTGFSPIAPFDASITFSKPSSWPSWGRILGAGNNNAASYQYCCLARNGYGTYMTATNGDSANKSVRVDFDENATTHTVDFICSSAGSTQIKYNGTLQGTITNEVSSTVASYGSVYLFGYNQCNVNGTQMASTPILLSSFRLYSCKIYQNDIFTRDYVPVRVGTEGAMMDVLTRRIYRNDGTGAFGYGNDLKYPIPSE